MERNFEPQNNLNIEAQPALAKGLMTNVFTWMFIALCLTALTSWIFASSTQLMSLLINTESGSMSILGWIVMLAPLGMVLIMGSRIDKMSAGNMTLLFLLYAVLMGMSLSFIFLVYTGASIAKTFLISAGMFGIMAVVGYITQTDLSKFGRILFMGLIGIIIATLVNFFTQSTRVDYIISFLGVLIFTGLTAYDVQQLKKMANNQLLENETMRKVAIWGALTLYLDFINLFLYLLRFFGRND